MRRSGSSRATSTASPARRRRRRGSGRCAWRWAPSTTRRATTARSPSRRGYTSLRVTLGAGAGHNWWCVIFPPLCAQAAGLSEQAVQALSDDDVRLVTESDGGYVVRFRLLELWDALVQRLS